MSSRYGEQDYDRENYGSGQNRYGARSRGRERSGERYRSQRPRDDEGYGRSRGSSEYAWSEGRGWQSGREDYGSGSWEGEGQPYGERSRRPYEQDYRSERYEGGSPGYMQRSNYPRSSFGFGERYSERDDYGYGSAGRYGERGDYGRQSQRYGEPGDYGRQSQRYGERGSYGRESSRDYDRGDESHWWDKVAAWFGSEDDKRRQRTGEQGSRQHRGRGPKGYRRSDDRIREDVNDRLSDDQYLDASNIEVKVEESVVILTGTVDDRYDKRRAEDIAESVSGVTNVENRLRVGTSGSLGTSSSMGTTSNTGPTSGSTSTDATATGRGRSQNA